MDEIATFLVTVYTSKQQLKKWILSRAINRIFNGTDDHSEVFAYMIGETIIKPEQIVGYLEI